MANFTVKNWDYLATAIHAERVKQIKDFNGLGARALEDFAYRLVEHFEADNRNFSRAKFLEVATAKI